MANKTKQYSQLLFELTAGKKQAEAKKIIGEFVKFLVDKNLLHLQAGILGDFEEIWNKENDVLSAEVVSAYPLDKKMVEEIKSYLLQKVKFTPSEIVLKQVVDKKLLGGFIIRFEDKVFDASLKSRVSNLKEKISS